MTAQQAAQQIEAALKKDIPEATYNWPAVAASLGNTPGEQLGEALEFVGWIEEALVASHQNAQQIENLVAELHHSLEMFWRCLALRNGQGYVDEVFQRHEDALLERKSHESGRDAAGA